MARCRRPPIDIQVEPLRSLSGVFDDGASMAMFGWYLENGPLVDFYIFDSRAIPTAENGRTGSNYFGYRDAEADTLVAALRDSCNPGERADLFARLQRRVMADLPLLPLYFAPEAMVVPSWLAVPAPSAPNFFLPEMIEHWTLRN